MCMIRRKNHRSLLGNIVWILLLAQNLLALSPKLRIVDGRELGINVTKPPLQFTNSTILSHPKCGGSYWVGNYAKRLSIPRSSRKNPVHCRWLLKAGDIQNTIGLSTVNTTFSMDEDIDYYFKLEARDGWKDDSTLLASLEWSDGFISVDWAFLKPIKATSGFLLLEYTNKGNNPLQMDFVYFTCGGRADSKTYISSPVFTGLPLKPEIVDCQWVFTKPEDALYGYLRPLEINISDCDVLQMRSNSSMQIIYEKSQNEIDISSNLVMNRTTKHGALENFIKWAKEQTNLTEGIDSDVYKPKNRTIASICGNSTKMVVFQSTVAKLRYLSTDSSIDVRFKALYSTFKLPARWESKRIRKIPWFYTYSTLTVFAPIGVVLGIVIILYSSRRRGPNRPYSSEMFDSSDYKRDGRRSASFHSRGNFRLGSFIKLPVRRSKSLSNMKFTLPNQASTAGGEISDDNKDKKYFSKSRKSSEVTVPFVVLVKSDNEISRRVATRPGILRQLSKSTDCVANNNNDENCHVTKCDKISYDARSKEKKKHVRFNKLITDGTRSL